MSDDDRESGGANDDTNDAQEPQTAAVLASGSEVLAATADLCVRLQRISTAQRPSKVDPALAEPIDPALAERRRYIRMLHEISLFLKRVWIDTGRLQAEDRIFQLCAALDQLGDGAVHPVLRPPTTGRPGVKPDRFDVWNGRKWVCLALECYIKAGTKKSDAVKLIARKNSGLKAFIRVGTGKDRGGLAKAILSWHRAFYDGTANELAQSSWGEARQLVIEPPAASAEEWLNRAQIFLTKANEAATTLIKAESRNNRGD